MTKHFVYVHRRKSDGSVFYVGQGTGRRATSKRRNRWWHAVVQKHGFTAHKIAEGLSQECALSIERAVIKHYGRENLCNLTDGGDIGPTGHVKTEEHLKKLRAYRPTDETRAKISSSIAGRNHPNYNPETITLIHDEYGEITTTRFEFYETFGVRLRKLSAMLSGKQKSSRGWRLLGMPSNKSLSEETKLRISKAMKGNQHALGHKMSEEHKEKLSAALKGRKLPEHIAKKRHGPGNPNHKPEPITMTHPEHGTVSAPRLHFVNHHGIPKSGLSNVLSGRQQSCRGWRLTIR